MDDLGTSPFIGKLVSHAAAKSVLNKLLVDVSAEIESNPNPFRNNIYLEKARSFISAALPIVDMAIHSELQDDLLERLKKVAYDIEDLLDQAATRRLQTNSVLKKVVSSIRLKKLLREDGRRLKLLLEDKVVVNLSSYISTIENKPGVPDQTFFTRARSAKETSVMVEVILRRLARSAKETSFMEEDIVWRGARSAKETSVMEEVILGREEDVERLIRCICSPSTGLQRPTVVNVYGPGGIGKSSLVRLVSDDSRVSSNFDLVKWTSYDCSLSFEGGLQKLARDMVAPSSGFSSPMPSSEPKDRLGSILKGQRFLLVVDDIKDEFNSEWKEYLELLKVGSEGSTVILISWSSIVIKECLHAFEVECISEGQCWCLFERYAGFDKAAAALKDIGRSIVKKCGGSPLAVKTLATLLSINKDRPHCWEQVHRSKLWAEKYNKAWTAWCICLELLPVELISLYATFPIFARHTFMCMDKLVWFWMAHGLLQPANEKANLRDIGLRIFNELESMNYLPFSPSGTHIGTLLGRKFVEVVSAEYISHAKGDFPPSTRRHLLWTGGDVCLPYELLEKARTFFFRWPDTSQSMNKPFLDGLTSQLKCLRVLLLDDSKLEELPESIGNLKLLRYLSLARSYRLQVLPRSVCKLVNLQTLDLDGCEGLIKLPSNMLKLVSLRHLLLSGKLRSLPLNSWTSLHYLEISHSPILTSLGKKGKELSKLTSALRNLILFDCPLIDLLPDSLLPHLKEFCIIRLPYLLELPLGLKSAADSLEQLYIINCDNLDLERGNALHLRSLKSLKIEGLPKMFKIPCFLHDLADSLEHLSIRRCENLKSTGLQGLCHLRSLKSLKIESLPNISEIPDLLHDLADSLEHLSIRWCGNLELRGWQGLCHLQSLKSLQFIGLPKLLELPDGLKIAADSLQHLDISICYNLETLPESLSYCTGLVDIIIEDCPKLLALPQGFHALKNMKELKILKCPDLIKMCEREDGGDWHLISHIPNIYLGNKAIRYRKDTSTVQEQLGSLPSKETRAVSAASPTEIMPVTEDHSSSRSECNDFPSTIEHRLSSPPSEGAAEHPHPVSVEHSYPSHLYGMDIDVQQASIPVTHHPDTDAVGLKHPGASSTEEPFGTQVLEFVKKVEGKGILLLFGEGCEFEKEMLIQLWMALEILMEEPMEVIGAYCFEKLVIEGYILSSVTDSLYKANVEKLNTELDVIIDNPSCLILDSESRSYGTSAETLHASVVCDEIDVSVFKSLAGFDKLRTLLFLGNYGSRLQRVPRDLFVRYGSLAALDLSGTHIKELPSTAGNMINLRYLDLSWTFIDVLPERIDLFEKLQTLKLEGCYHLRRLPKEMKGLKQLRHLHLNVLRQLASFPEGMGALVNLRTLSAFPVGNEEGLKICELKYLNNITGEFCIAKMENVQSTDEAKEATLTAKRNIRKLKLRWSIHPLQEPKSEVDSILKNLCPHSDLEEIHILCYPGSRFPDWVADVSFHKLVNITLFRCAHVAMLPSLEKLPSLKFLELNSMNSVIGMDCKGEAGKVAFPKLQKLTIDEMLNLQVWTKAHEGDYSCLVELIIKDCPMLLELPSLLYLPTIKHVELSGCSKLAFLSERELSLSLQQLIVENCPSIKERCFSEEGEDWHKIQRVTTIWVDQVKIQPYEDA